jgi:predicted NACHT family NTPase
MSKQIYAWKRFWCSRQGNINLADDGYLYDPDAEWGKVYNPDLVSLEEIADVPCLILLGEPGIGKSQELGNLKTLTEKKICDPRQVLELNLRSCTNLKEDLFKDDTFINWLGDTYHLYLFLDSLDEGLLSVPNIATGLIDELCKNKYQNHFDRLHIRIACRTFIFPAILEEGLKELWQEDRIAIYELAPLRRVDVIDAANADNLSSCDFLKEVRQKNVVPLAIKPLSLRFLLNTYHHNDGQFPSNQKIDELYLKGCELLCTEINSSRQSSNKTGNLDSKQRLIVAARIAAITIFTNRFAVWTTIDLGNVPIEDVCLQALCAGCENSNGREFDITEKIIKEVLDTGLFSSRGLNRMGWAHQIYAEFLAAWYLKQHEISLAQITELIFSSEDPDRELIPQLHETAAWLASMRVDVFQKIITTDPDVLLRSDIPTDTSIRKLIVDNLLQQYEARKLFDRDRNNYRNCAKLNHPELDTQLRFYICDSSKQVDARDLAIDIAEICERSELQEDLLNLAFDSSQPIDLRVSAVKAIGSIGDAYTKLKLKSFAIEQIPDDESDGIKGYSLQALWPDLITVAELFQVLTPPKKRNVFGAYQMFLEYQMVAKLYPDDLVVALDWLALQGVRCFGHPFEKLGDDILLKAWENFDLPGVLKGFTKVALIQWREHQSIITDGYHSRQQQFALSSSHNAKKRHTLIKQVVLIISETDEEPSFLFGRLTKNILVIDFCWMLEMLQFSNCEKVQKIWTQLITWGFLGCQDASQIDTLILATQTNNILCREFGSYFEAIDLNSDLAARLKAQYLEMEEMNKHYQLPLLEPPPKDRVVQCLEQLELGNISVWWDLNRQMTLRSDSQYYGDELELDLTKLPGWLEAGEITQNRIIEGAKLYVQQQDDIDYEWIGTDTFNRPALAGSKALQLLLQEDPNFLDRLPSEIWKKWSSILIASPRSNHDEYYLELVKRAYLNAPEESLHTLLKLIDKENLKYDYLFAIDRFDKCWDEQLKLALLEKVKDPNLKPKYVGQLLEWLLKRGAREAKDFAKSLICFPLPLAEKDRERTLIGAKLLVENSDPSSWSFIWSLIQQDLSFGCQVIELAASRSSQGIELDISEQQLADFYIWLVHQYPYDEDPDYSNDIMAHCVTNRECIAGLRNSVLFQLKERGNLQSCTEIQRLIQELPDITWLGRTLIDAKANMRRKTWQPPLPEDILQIVDSQLKKLMTEQSNPNFSGATFNAPVNFASNYGNQAQNINIETTEQNFDLILADFKQFISDLQAQHPNVNTPELATQTIVSQAKQLPPARLQNFLSLKRLWNGTKKATLKAGEHLAENNIWGKAGIGFLEGVSDDT